MWGLNYLGLTSAISWSPMPWLLGWPGHQQPWYWLCKLGRALSYMRKISMTCVMSMWRIVRNCEYMFIFLLKNLARKDRAIIHTCVCVCVCVCVGGGGGGGGGGYDSVSYNITVICLKISHAFTTKEPAYYPPWWKPMLLNIEEFSFCFTFHTKVTCIV